jgi:hypothetical protein
MEKEQSNYRHRSLEKVPSACPPLPFLDEARARIWIRTVKFLMISPPSYGLHAGTGENVENNLCSFLLLPVRQDWRYMISIVLLSYGKKSWNSFCTIDIFLKPSGIQKNVIEQNTTKCTLRNVTIENGSKPRFNGSLKLALFLSRRFAKTTDHRIRSLKN